MRFTLATTDYARDEQVIRDSLVATLKHRFDSITDDDIETAWHKRNVLTDEDGKALVVVYWPILRAN